MINSGLNKIAEFYKVSMEEFEHTYKEKVDHTKSSDEIRTIYDNIVLPNRATRGSAGYDFHSPFDFELNSGEEILIPFGIRVKIDDGWVLQLFPRSGLGSRYRFQLNNTVGIIDSDYFHAANEGHIMSILSNCSHEKDKILKIKAKDAILQGVFIPYGITYGDDEHLKTIRTGGFGSTDNRND